LYESGRLLTVIVSHEVKAYTAKAVGLSLICPNAARWRRCNYVSTNRK